MPLIACLNGEVQPLERVRISPMDRGFLFGDSIYEVIRVYRGKPFLMNEHFARLKRSLGAMKIEGVDLDQLQGRVMKLLAQSREEEATVYIQISRGVSLSRAHAFPQTKTAPTEFLFVSAYRDKEPELREVGASVITYPDLRWRRVDIKTVNLLGNVFAAEAAREAGAYEALLFTEEGAITEGAHSNVFFILGGELRTMPLGKGILPGVTRALVLSLAEEAGLKLQEVPVSLREVERVTEAFLTSTTAEVMPVVKVDQTRIGDGAPGELARQLVRRYRERIEAFVAGGT